MAIRVFLPTAGPDLVAAQTHAGAWGHLQHTLYFGQIRREMFHKKIERRAFTDTVQRHSLRFSETLYDEVFAGAMQFGEHLVFPSLGSTICQ